MYKGHSRAFKLEDKEYTLARPSYREMAGFINLVDDGQHLEILLAAAENKDALDKVLDTADHEKIDALIASYEEFAGYSVFTKTSLERQMRLSELTYNLLKAQGITAHETFQSYMQEKMDITQ